MHLRIPALALLLGVNLIVAGTPLVKSTDGGRTWVDIGPGPAHQGIIQLQISGSRLYALTVTSTEAPPLDQLGDFSVLSSTDGWQTWRTLDLLGVTKGFAAMAVASSDPETLYVTRGGLGRTITDGATITLVRSTDGGATVNEIESAEKALRRFNTYPACCSPKPVFLGVHPALAATLFMAFDCSGDSMDPFHAFVLSRDGGLNWFANSSVGWLNTLPGGGTRKPDLAVTRLLADPGEPSLVYAVNRGSDGKFHFAKSSDEGDSWSAPLLHNVASAALHPRGPAVLLASKHDGSLWKSNDRAETWQHLGNWLPFDRIAVHQAKDAVILARAPAVLHQGINTGEIFKSQDGGATWSVIPTGMDGFSFVFDPANPDIIYGISGRRTEVRPHHREFHANGRHDYTTSLTHGDLAPRWERLGRRWLHLRCQPIQCWQVGRRRTSRPFHGNLHFHRGSMLSPHALATRALCSATELYDPATGTFAATGTHADPRGDSPLCH